MNYEVNISELPSAKELSHLFAQTSWAAQRTHQDIQKMLDNLTVFVTLRKDAELIGFGRAITDGIYRALIDDIVVDSAHQKKGFGSVIVKNLLAQLNGIEEIFLNTKPELEEFYKKFGFNKVTIITMRK